MTATSPTYPAPATAATGERVLVVDDDPDIARLVAATLRLDGYRVALAGDGGTALELLRGGGADLVLLDVMMPELDGVSVTRLLRADPRTVPVPVILLTARGSTADKVAGLAAGADDYIVKPFNPAELLARVGTARARTSTLRTLSPLTGLPGNAAIDAELDRRLDTGQEFAVAHVDLDHFKEFNDCCGYARGDDAIRALADVLVEAGPPAHGLFVGHIGGDDFLLVGRTGDVLTTTRRVAARFPGRVAALTEPAAGRRERAAGDRRAAPPALTVSVGVTVARAGQFPGRRELAAAAAQVKTAAKRAGGATVVVDRRRAA